VRVRANVVLVAQAMATKALVDRFENPPSGGTNIHSVLREALEELLRRPRLAAQHSLSATRSCCLLVCALMLWRDARWSVVRAHGRVQLGPSWRGFRLDLLRRVGHAAAPRDTVLRACALGAEAADLCRHQVRSPAQS